MKRRGRLAGLNAAASIIALALAVVAWGDTKYVADPQGDAETGVGGSPNSADISGAKAGHGQGHPNVLVHKLFFYGFPSWEDGGNGGGNEGCFHLFLQPSDPSFYRLVCYSPARMVRHRANGECCVVTNFTPRVTEAAQSLRFAFPRRALPAVTTRYYWRGVTAHTTGGNGNCGASPDACYDNVPDSGTIRHTLPSP